MAIENGNDPGNSSSTTNENEIELTRRFAQISNETGDFYDGFISVEQKTTNNPHDSSNTNEAVLTDESVHNTNVLAHQSARENYNHTQSNECTTVAIPQFVPEIECLIYLKHPIRTIFHVRHNTEFTHGTYNPKNYLLNDCINKTCLYFGPISALNRKKTVAALVFMHEGKLYIAPYQFAYISGTSLKETANPIIIDLEKDTVRMDDYLPFAITIAKANNNSLRSSDGHSNGKCEIKEFFTGDVVSIDSKYIKTSQKKGNQTQKRIKRIHVGPTTIKNFIDVHKLYLILCPYDVNAVANGNKIEWKSEILFCSNAFRPAARSFKEDKFDFQDNKLILGDVSIQPPCIPNQLIVIIPTIIPDMYKCTQLKDKFFKIEIVTTSDDACSPHPLYKFENGEDMEDCLWIPAHQYNQTLTITLKKLTKEEYEHNPIVNQGLTTTTSTNASVRTVEIDTAAIDSFRVQVQLCHQSDTESSEYELSMVKSKILSLPPNSCEENIQYSSSVNETITDNSYPISDQLSLQVKRTNEKDSTSRPNSPQSKALKTDDSISCDV